MSGANPFYLPTAQFEQEVVYSTPLNERKGGWREVKAASLERIVEMITRIDYHGMPFFTFSPFSFLILLSLCYSSLLNYIYILLLSQSLQYLYICTLSSCVSISVPLQHSVLPFHNSHFRVIYITNIIILI